MHLLAYVSAFEIFSLNFSEIKHLLTEVMPVDITHR